VVKGGEEWTWTVDGTV